MADCFDNCTNLYNPDQADADCDGVGDACDQWPGCDDSLDTDGDGTPDCVDLDELANWECHQNGKKAYICHIPPGNPANQHTICISKNAVGTHLNNHGDYIGECYQVACGGSSRPGYGGTALIDRALEANGFHLYPNPSGGAITLELSGYLEQELSISIYNALGREVYRRPGQVQEEALLRIDLREQQLPDGVYWLAVQADEGRMVKQFVVAR